MTYVPLRTSTNAYMTDYRLTEMHNLLFSTTNVKIILQKCSFMKVKRHELELITRVKNTNKRELPINLFEDKNCESRKMGECVKVFSCFHIETSQL